MYRDRDPDGIRPDGGGMRMDAIETVIWTLFMVVVTINTAVILNIYFDNEGGRGK